ncbi:MAG TPA: nuclear transport factor 2 family protein [Actinocrinis sp.]|nr:nuclear transport factor 2 family protein [Actinocrinis sp.]
MSVLTEERVRAAYAALGSGDRAQIAQYWAEDMRFLTPGNHPFAGWHNGLDAFVDFMGKVGEASAGSFDIDIAVVLVNDEYSVDLNHTTARRSHAKPESTSPYDVLDINGLHALRWRDGKVVEGRGAIFGDGMTGFNQWWSPLDENGERTEL